jgi:hypothetical protein
MLPLRVLSSGRRTALKYLISTHYSLIISFIKISMIKFK